MAELAVLVDHLSFPEGPRWHEGRLWFSDIHRREVLTMTTDRVVSVAAAVPNQPSGLGWLPNGTLLVVSMLDRQLLCLAGDELGNYADLSDYGTDLCNDMVVDDFGRAYVGCVSTERRTGSHLGSIVLVNTDRSVRPVADGVEGPNGSVITPDGGKLIIAETLGRRSDAWDRSPDGSLSNRRVWADLDDISPDGICLDAEGAIWVADLAGSRVVRVVEGGAVLESLSVHGRFALACALGGDEGNTLFVCTSTGSYRPAWQERRGRIEVATVATPARDDPLAALTSSAFICE